MKSTKYQLGVSLCVLDFAMSTEKRQNELLKKCREIITEHDDWEQLNQQKLNSTNEER